MYMHNDTVDESMQSDVSVLTLKSSQNVTASDFLVEVNKIRL